MSRTISSSAPDGDRCVETDGKSANGQCRQQKVIARSVRELLAPGAGLCGVAVPGSNPKTAFRVNPKDWFAHF